MESDTPSAESPSVKASFPLSPALFADETTLDGSVQCCVGVLLNPTSKCSGQSRLMSPTERHAVKLLFGVEEVADESILCSRHVKNIYIYALPPSSKRCFNPFESHGLRRTQLVPVTAFLRAVLIEANHVVKPRSALCKSCMASVNRLILQSSSQLSDESGCNGNGALSNGNGALSNSNGALSNSNWALSNGNGALSSQLSDKTVHERAKTDVENIFNVLGVEPIELTGYHKNEKIQAVQTKHAEVSKIIKDKLFKSVNIFKYPVDKCFDELEARALNYDKLMSALKDRILISNYRDTVKLLTLAPDSLSQKEIATMLGVSLHQVKISRSLKEKKGILAELEVKRGKCVAEEDVKRVLQFYNDDEYSRMCPGRRDTVSMGKKEHVQKRLLLGTLDELFVEFTRIHPNCKIGKSNFCDLRPKWCILSNAAGTHNVSVCTYHENIKLLMNAIDLGKEDLKQLMTEVQCVVPSLECKLRLCSKCCQKENVKKKVEVLVKNCLANEDELGNIFNEECDQEIEFRQWVRTNRADLQTLKVTSSEFVDIFCDQLLVIIPHSYVSKEQSTFIKNLKASISKESVIVHLDFAENLSFTIQDEIQSFHFKRGQCSIHPAAITYKSSNNTIEQYSLCFISDDLNHDVAFVQTVIKQVYQFVKEKLPQCKKVEFVSDGCTEQYKNCRTFLNLCKFQEKFDLRARWTFYATSHSKNVCTGLGGAVKRAAFLESLRRVKVNTPPIKNIQSLYNFCKEREAKKATEILHFLISKEEIEAEREFQELLNPKTFQGIRSFHSFEPMSTQKVACKFTSSVVKYALVVDMLKEQPEQDWKAGSFVAFVVQEEWFSAFVNEIDYEENEAQVTVLARRGKTKSKVYWEDTNIMFVPISTILCETDVEILDDCITLKTSLKKINTLLKKNLLEGELFAT